MSVARTLTDSAMPRGRRGGGAYFPPASHIWPASAHSRAGETHLIGVNVSKPLTALHGRPFFFTSSCRLRAVMSTASAARRRSVRAEGVRREHAERALMRTIARDVRIGISLRDVSATLANDKPELHWAVARQMA